MKDACPASERTWVSLKWYKIQDGYLEEIEVFKIINCGSSLLDQLDYLEIQNIPDPLRLLSLLINLGLA